jgi:hypothetical protein
MKVFVFALMLGISLPAKAAVDELASTLEPQVDSVQKSRHGLTAGMVLPQPLSLGYEYINPDLDRFHFFAEGGYFYWPLSTRLTNVSAWSIQAGARFFPVNDWFYLSGALGFRQIGVGADLSSLQMDGVALANRADLKLNAAILGVALGGQWSINADMALAVDLGVQLPIPLLHGGTTEIVQDQPDGTDLSVDDSDALYRISGMLVPQIALIRFIWYIR